MKRLFLIELYIPALFQMTIGLIRNLHLYMSKSKSDVFSRTDCVAPGTRQFSACMRSVCLPCISITSILCLQTKSDKELVFIIIDPSILIISLKFFCIYIFVKTTVGSLLSNNPERSRCDLRNDVIN